MRFVAQKKRHYVICVFAVSVTELSDKMPVISSLEMRTY
jgi:hypothetical protein